jgi:peroxiredoxin
MTLVSTCRSAARFAAIIAASCATAAASAQQIAQVDRPAPELDVRLLSGKLLKAKELRGKVVVNVIWATWSPAARMELREVQRVYRDHRDKGLEVVALSIDEHPGEVRDFWRQREYSFPVAMRSDAFFDHYGRVSTTPMFYIIDRQGTLRHRIPGTIGTEKLELLLKPLLAEPVPAARVAKKN